MTDYVIYLRFWDRTQFLNHLPRIFMGVYLVGKKYLSFSDLENTGSIPMLADKSCPFALA